MKDYITIDKEIVSGTPVFKGTRVPVQSLFDHLRHGVSPDKFLDSFPSVSKEQAEVVIEIAGRIIVPALQKFLNTPRNSRAHEVILSK